MLVIYIFLFCPTYLFLCSSIDEILCIEKAFFTTTSKPHPKPFHKHILESLLLTHRKLYHKLYHSYALEFFTVEEKLRNLSFQTYVPFSKIRCISPRINLAAPHYNILTNLKKDYFFFTLPYFNIIIIKIFRLYFSQNTKFTKLYFKYNNVCRYLHKKLLFYF